MSRLAPIAPPDDARLWRLLLSRAHPDSGGTHDLFLWVQSLRDLIAGHGHGHGHGHTPEPEHSAPATDNPRVPFDPELADLENQMNLIERALLVATEAGEPYSGVLRLVRSAPLRDHGRAALAAGKDATYRQLAYIGHLAGFDPEHRGCFYELAESIPMSQHIAGHLIKVLKDGSMSRD